jgi:N-acetylneuraminic acid mutarotase
LKTPRSKFGCVTIERNIYILGGKKGRERVSDVEIWNNGNWKTGAALKKKRSGFGVISYDHFIYIIGGNDGENILSSVEVLDT